MTIIRMVAKAYEFDESAPEPAGSIRMRRLKTLPGSCPGCGSSETAWDGDEGSEATCADCGEHFNGERQYLLPGVEVFHSGLYRAGTDEEFECSDADIDQMAENFAAFSSGDRPTLEPGIGVGHEEDEHELFADDSTLSHGTVADAWTKPGKIKIDRKFTQRNFLFGDLIVGEDAADMVRKKKLTRVSAEIRPEPPDWCGGTGKTLVRVALLGLAPPEAKLLKKLPDPVPVANTKYSERGSARSYVRRYADTGKTICFTEIVRANQPVHQFEGIDMDKATAMQWLTDQGYDPAGDFNITDTTPDEAVIALVTALQAISGGGAANPDATGDTMDQGQFADDAVDLPDADLDVAHPVSPGLAEGDVKDDDTTYAKMADSTSVAPATPAKSGPAPSSITVKFSEKAVINTLRRQQAEIDQLKRANANRNANDNRDRVQKFCDSLIRSGQFTPADVDPKGGPLTPLADLLRASKSSDMTTVKFSDGSKRKLSALELLEMKFRKLPVKTAREKIHSFSDSGNGGVAPEQRGLKAALDRIIKQRKPHNN